ncbi:hypothetical protein TGFOU_464925 [Toxoplasma gondii FOU]|uniref:Uncharacterized protein n=2 Tax=Toxoplasma gondii TaxID=5811 RepID=A0A086LI34_TOXGO|nr:hypothetical protein TGFOU_464925 [Toxoplasma gondii FOU]
MFLLPLRIRVAKLRRGVTHTTVFSGSFLFCCFSLFIQKKLENALSREKEETVKLRQRLGETRKKLVVSEARRKQESSGFAVDLKSLRSRMKSLEAWNGTLAAIIERQVRPILSSRERGEGAPEKRTKINRTRRQERETKGSLRRGGRDRKRQAKRRGKAKGIRRRDGSKEKKTKGEKQEKSSRTERIAS